MPLETAQQTKGKIMKQHQLHKYRLFRLKNGKYVAEVKYSFYYQGKITRTKRFISKNLNSVAAKYISMIEEYSQ